MKKSFPSRCPLIATSIRFLCNCSKCLYVNRSNYECILLFIPPLFKKINSSILYYFLFVTFFFSWRFLPNECLESITILCHSCIVFHCRVDHNLCNQFSICKHLNCFQTSAVTNNATAKADICYFTHEQL